MIDDDPDECALAALLLTRALPGARIEEAALPFSLTQALSCARFDVIVAEHALTWGDRTDLLRTLRACQPAAAVVILTRVSDATVAVEALKAGAFECLVKGPRSYLRLAAVVESARHHTVPDGNDVELREQVRQLTAANRRLADFPFTAAHELDAPLRLVSRQIAHLKRVRDGLDEEARKAVDAVAAGTGRMQGLIDSLLTFARLGSERAAVDACDCNALVDRAIEQVLAEAGTGDATITRTHLPTVAGDAGQLLLLFRNLLANAVKFRAETSPQVTVSAEVGGDLCVFSVRDNGIGIPPEQAKRLFGMFQRLRPEYPGIGLGLVICQRIVEQHGGRIWMESSGGTGTTFFFTLPVLAGRIAPQIEPRPQERPAE